MNIFLTGATGTIGSAVADVLKQSGHTVIGLARSDESAVRLVERGIEVYRGDLLDPTTLTEGARQADAVIHTAQPQPTPDMDFAALSAIANNTLTALFDGLRGSNKRLIITSGTGAYGDTGANIVDEDSPLDQSPMMEGFRHMEQRVLDAVAEQIHTTIIRPSVVYGRGGSGPVLGMIGIAQQFGGGVYVDAGDKLTSTVHVDDLASLYLLALEKAPAGHVFNGVAEPFVLVKDLAEAISYAAGLDGKTVSVPVKEAWQQFGFMAHFLADHMHVSA
ncbi:MAG: NAD-dependent epimerase/dehydratase family protein, partial [Chloroflexota bacterium]